MQGPDRHASAMDPGVRGVLDIARGVLTDLDLEVVLDRVLHSAREMTGARYAALGVLDESRSELQRFITSGMDQATRDQIGALPRGRGVLGELIADPRPLRLDDVGMHPRSYGFPAGHPPMETFVGVPVVVAGQPYGNLYLTDKEGGEPFTDEDEEALVLLAEFAGVAIDHARRFTGSEQRRGELERTVAALDATVQISRALGGQTDPDAILELVAKRGRALVSAKALVIELLRGEELVIAAAAGEVPPGLIGRRVPIEDTVASNALRNQRPQRIEDTLNRQRFEQRGLGTLGLSASAGLVVPLVFRGRGYGVLVAVDRIGGDPTFTAEDSRLLEAFAASAATAVATAEAGVLEQRRQRLAAAEEERRRWARELHDETLQSLAALRISLSSARRANDPALLDGVMEKAIGQLDADIATLRSLITELRPAALDELGVKAAIGALADRVSNMGLDVDVSIDLPAADTDRLDAEVETAVYRIVQESLTNARKHGDATRASVDVREEGSDVVIAVRDNGRGFDTATKSSGFGLLGMRERTELLDGTLHIASKPGEGATVRVTLPARRRGAEPPLGTLRSVAAGGP